jgi:hypothetical protein
LSDNNFLSLRLQTISRLHVLNEAQISGLAELLIDCVAGGA